MQPNTTMPNGVGSSDPKMSKGLGVVILVIIILVLVVFASKSYNNHSVSSGKFSSENVTTVDNNKSVPSGFPAGIPLEMDNIANSSTLVYPDKKVTLYNVSYISTKQMEELYSTYKTYFVSNAYAVETLERDATAYKLHAINRNGNDITVTISPQQSEDLVSISYVSRQ